MRFSERSYWRSKKLQVTQRAIFNLKLPMKKRVAALKDALDSMRKTLNAKGIRYQLEARQLYHDREEVTVYLARKRNNRPFSESRRIGDALNKPPFGKGGGRRI